MKKLLFILVIFLSGCVNREGITTEYYDDCHIEYDMYGGYEEKCKNIYNFKKEEKKDCLQCN